MIQTSLLFETVEEIYQRVFREIKPRTILPEIVVRFCSYVHMDSRIRLDGDHKRIEVRISDQLAGAPAPVQEALAHILLGKLYRKKIAPSYNRRYRLYTQREDVRRKALLVKQLRGRKQILAARGKAYDLEEMFDRLNERLFDNLLARPRLTWSLRRSRRSLGHWDPVHNTIVISRIFDEPEVPRFLVEYVLYHEMLHLKHPVEYARGRKRAHTKQFHADERKFPSYQEAVALLKLL
ncbi:MAG: SprT-like domain-containing protein [Bryobacterales bacterium]|nr:SprT-like domain-containing protein [Bryobacterales bacterium]